MQKAILLLFIKVLPYKPSKKKLIMKKKAKDKLIEY